MNQSVNVGGTGRGKFTAFPTQGGSFFQWMNTVRPRYAYSAYNTISATYWSTNLPAYEFYWSEPGSTLSTSYEICPSSYRRVSDGATDGEPTGASELRQSLWADPNAAKADNTLTGYYADGFFDRRAIGDSNTSPVVANSTVSRSTETVAYKGRLFYNAVTKASLFFPSAGRRLENRNLDGAGSKGYYWTASSTVSTTIPTVPSDFKAYISISPRSAAVNIRCVAE